MSFLRRSSSSQPTENGTILTEEGENDENDADVKVYVRFRPMNKLEISRRSHTCVKFHLGDNNDKYNISDISALMEVSKNGDSKIEQRNDERDNASLRNSNSNSNYLTIDSPFEGEFQFHFDKIFKEETKQEEVYDSISIHAKRLINGYNNAVIAFGQSGSGKTTTMMGENPLQQKDSIDETKISSKQNIEILDCTGMIPRMAKEIFDAMKKASPVIEFTVRVSFVEIYLEQIRDLLNPSKRFLKINDGEDKSDYERLKGPILEGLTEICCLDWSEVVGLLFRGNSYRVVSEQRKQTDLNQSHTIFTIKIEQRNKVTERTMTSSMNLVDLAGSELEKQVQKTKTYSNTTIPLGISKQPVQERERNVINRSHIALKKVIDILEAYHDPSNHNGTKPSLPPHPDDLPYHESKVTRLLCNALGGNCYTTLILTASPATFNISATLATLRFGARCRRIQNFPYVNIEASPEECNIELEKSKKIQSELLILIKQIGIEMKKIKDKGAMTNNFGNDDTLWERLNEICESNKYFVLDEQSENEKSNPISLSLQDELKRKEDEIKELQSKLSETRKARDKAQTQMLEMEGECVFLRNESEEVLEAKKRNTEEIIDAQNEIQRLSQLKLELEHSLRTSQFRETEAVTFTRLFRRFYRKLLQNNAAHGSKNPNEVMLRMAGVPNLDDLIDIDQLMYQSGILEDHEVNSNMDDKEYNPSLNAIVRSSALASKAKRQARLEITRSRSHTVDMTSLTDSSRFTLSTKSGNDSLKEVIVVPSEDSSDSPSLGIPTSVSPTNTYSPKGGGGGQVRFADSPASKLTDKRLNQLDRDLLHITRRCIDLQMALNESEEWIELLTMSKSKSRVLKENTELQKELRKKDSDLKALIWKMNEINILNTTYNQRLTSKEHYINYLEEKLMKLQDRDMVQTYRKEETERKLRTEVMRLNTLLDAMARIHWQDGKKARSQRLESRIVIPFQGGASLDDKTREVLLQGQKLGGGYQNFSETDSRDERTSAGISYAPSYGPSIASSIYVDKNQSSLKHDDMSLLTRPFSQQLDPTLHSLKENNATADNVMNTFMTGGKSEFYEPRRTTNRKQLEVKPAVMKPNQQKPSSASSFASSQMERQRSLNDTRKKLNDLEMMWTTQ